MHNIEKMTLPAESTDGESNTAIRNRFGFRRFSIKQKGQRRRALEGVNAYQSNGNTTLPRQSKIGKLVRRSMSAISTPTTPKHYLPASALSADAEPSPPLDGELSCSSSSSKEQVHDNKSQTPSDSEDDEITNAFIFNAANKTSQTEKQHELVSRHSSFSPPTRKRTVKSVKVSHFHSQKSPHVRYAAGKLASHNTMDSKWNTLGKPRTSPLVSKPEVHRRSSCPVIDSSKPVITGKKQPPAMYHRIDTCINGSLVVCVCNGLQGDSYFWTLVSAGES